jgi:hypothetical protein
MDESCGNFLAIPDPNMKLPAPAVRKIFFLTEEHLLKDYRIFDEPRKPQSKIPVKDDKTSM